MPGAAGTWKDLTGNVNLLAANLTTQVRAIAEVATAVTKGDLTRSIQVDARGEVAELKDNINTMIDNLRLTTDRNTEQDWLKTNLARFTSMLQGQRDLGDRRPHAAVRAGAAGRRAAGRHLPGRSTETAESAPPGGLCRSTSERPSATRCRLGEGLVGQCAVDERRMLLTEMPRQRRSDRLRPVQGACRRTLIVLPVLFEGQVKAVIELASLSALSPTCSCRSSSS